jgi:ketosteroid isomerase-like protein
MTDKEIVLAFVDAINRRDCGSLGELMADDHCFIDAHGNEVVGRDKMIAGWRGYFGMFPDYSIEVNEIFANGNSFAMFGFAGGSFKGKVEMGWRLPAAWKAIVRDGRIALWQVFADTKIPFEIIERAAAPD